MHGVKVISSPSTADTPGSLRWPVREVPRTNGGFHLPGSDYWDVQGYRSADYASVNETIFFAETDDDEPVQARHIAVYNNASRYGIRMTEFEVFGTGIFMFTLFGNIGQY